jgi:hypothetical protein
VPSVVPPAVGRGFCEPDAPGYSPGVMDWCTRAATTAACQPPGTENARAPHPHDHIHRPAP